MTEPMAAPTEGEPTILRRIGRSVFGSFQELYVVAVLGAGLFYRRELLVFYIFLGLALVLLLREIWQELGERKKRPAFISSIARRVASLFTTKPVVLRAARIGALGGVTMLVAAWLSWAAIDDALASSKMDGDINVVIASFHDLAGGEADASAASKQVSLWLESSLRTEFPEAVGGSTLSVKLVDNVIAGSAEQAERQALSLGHEHGANLVIYGDVLERGDADVLITPRFTFTGRESEALSAVDVATLVGGNALGEQIGPLDLGETQAALSARSRVIVHFLAGLVSLLADDPDSVRLFEEAQRITDELDLPENATTVAFLGQAYLNVHTDEAYDQARAAFDRALTLDPHHAGAHLGLANTLYLQARGSGDEALLIEAVSAYDRAMQSSLDTGVPIIPARAHLGRGNSLLLLARSDPETFESQARREYQSVLDLSVHCGQGGLSWWDPRGWGPWEDAFHDEPDYCPQMVELAAIAETVVANFAEVVRQSTVLAVTESPPGRATVVVDSTILQEGDEGSVHVRALGLTKPGLGAWSINVNFDLGLLSAQSCTSVYESACNPSFAPGTVRIAGASAAGLFDDAVLVQIVFRCREVGESVIELAVDVFADAALGGPRPIDVDVGNGRVTCLP